MVSTRRKENDKSRDYKVGDTVEVSCDEWMNLVTSVLLCSIVVIIS
jgi:hypothetical protein